MRREWKPGDVALVTVGGKERPAIRSATGNETWWLLDTATWADSRLQEVAVVRPLVVIDYEDRESVQRLADMVTNVRQGHNFGNAYPGEVDNLQAALREFADPTPPRIDEPGTWGVVGASCPHSDIRRQWVHHPDGNWWPAFDYSNVPERTPLPDSWDDLIDPVLVREGVTEDGPR